MNEDHSNIVSRTCAESSRWSRLLWLTSTFAGNSRHVWFRIARLFLALVVPASAQDFAPDRMENYIINYNATRARAPFEIGTNSKILTITGTAYEIHDTGDPLGVAHPFVWEKTGPNNGVFSVWNDDGRIMRLTFTSANAGTFEIIHPLHNGFKAGPFSLAKVPRTNSLLNISTRSALVSGEVLTSGFVVGGYAARRILIRAIGPTLGSAFNVSGAMARPTLTVFSGVTAIATNQGWGGSRPLMEAYASVGAFPLSPDSRDSALILTLGPGAYTASVSGDVGVVLIEIYSID